MRHSSAIRDGRPDGRTGPAGGRFFVTRDGHPDDEARFRHPGWPSGWRGRASPPGMAIRMAARAPTRDPDAESTRRHPDGELDGEPNLAIRGSGWWPAQAALMAACSGLPLQYSPPSRPRRRTCPKLRPNASPPGARPAGGSLVAELHLTGPVSTRCVSTDTMRSTEGN